MTQRDCKQQLGWGSELPVRLVDRRSSPSELRLSSFFPQHTSNSTSIKRQTFLKLAKKVKPLSPAALPLRFQLLSPLSPSSSPTACVSVSLPIRHRTSSSSATATTSAVKVEDFRQTSARPAIEVVRILDPEHQEPFVSLSRIFAACSLSPLEGLIRFSLRRPAYETSLGGVAPFSDIWTPLVTARKVALELGVAEELDALLEWETRSAWSVEDKEEGGIVHNWRIATDKIDPSGYSTDAMLSTPFPRIHLLPAGTQVRTLATPPPPALYRSRFPYSFESLWSRIVEWTTIEHEDYHELSTPPLLNTPTSSTTSLPSSPSPDLRLANLFTILLGFLRLLEEPESPQTPISESTLLIGDTLKVDRRTVIAGGPDAIRIATLGLSHILSKIVIRQWTSSLEDQIETDASPTQTDSITTKEGNRSIQRVEEKMKHLEEVIETLRATSSSSSALTEPDPLLLEELDEMRRRVEKLENLPPPRVRTGRPRSIPLPTATTASAFTSLELALLAIVGVLIWPHTIYVREWLEGTWERLRSIAL